MFIPELRSVDITPSRAVLTDNELRILQFALEAPGQVVLASLVEVRGGSSRAVGAQMAIRENGEYCGYVSGGCTEGAIAAEALRTIETGTDRFLKLGEGSPFFDIVLPCGGGITLALHIVRDQNPIRQVIDATAKRRRASLRYSPTSQHLAACGEAQTGWQGDAFVRGFRPRRRLAIAGSGIETATTADVARAAGYEVVELGSVPLDADTAVVILFHDLERELPFLEPALSTESCYIGALGSRATHERRCRALRERGHSEEAIGRIKGPIGLFGPARDSSTLALSILADIAH